MSAPSLRAEYSAKFGKKPNKGYRIHANAGNNRPLCGDAAYSSLSVSSFSRWLQCSDKPTCKLCLKRLEQGKAGVA